MRWNESQRRMLAQMGLRVWDGGVAVEEAAAAETDGEVAVEGDDDRASRSLSPAAEPPLHDAFADLGEPAATPAPHPTARRGSSASSASSTPTDIALLDWAGLRAAVAACRACTLCERRRNTVFGVGHPHAHWMIIGEAPGENEDLRGEPFVGKAGQLLDNMLASIGLTRGEAPPDRQVYIANTLKCRPPDNRNPAPDELARCEPFLARQIELVAPRVILAMGRFAVQSLLRSDLPVGKLRGKVHRYRDVPLVVTFHPAYLLRAPEEKARAWDDLCLALEVVASDARRNDVA